MAVLLVLAVLSITLALTYAMSRSSSTMFNLSSHEHAGLQAHCSADTSVCTTVNNLRADPNWMPLISPIRVELPPSERYQVDVTITQEGKGRNIAAAAQVIDPTDNHLLADQHLTIGLTKQARKNHPIAAIAAFARMASASYELPVYLATTDLSTESDYETDSASYGPPVYIAVGTTIRGNVRSRGPIQFQAGFVLQGVPYVMGSVSNAGTGYSGYLNYYAAWGASYPAAPLAESGSMDSAGWLHLSNVTLGPTAANPMGVYYHPGNVVLEDNVSITGTIVLKGYLAFVGTSIKLFALQQATDPASNATYTTSFPAVVVDGSVEFDPTADVVRISGLVLASQDVCRLDSSTGSKFPIAYGLIKQEIADPHDHTITIDAVPDPFGTVDGPAIYIKGAIMANYVSLRNVAGWPFALVFDAARTDITDAPGFFTWKATEWTEAN